MDTKTKIDELEKRIKKIEDYLIKCYENDHRQYENIDKFLRQQEERITSV